MCLFFVLLLFVVFYAGLLGFIRSFIGFFFLSFFLSFFSSFLACFFNASFVVVLWKDQKQALTSTVLHVFKSMSTPIDETLLTFVCVMEVWACLVSSCFVFNLPCQCWDLPNTSEYKIFFHLCVAHPHLLPFHKFVMD